MKGKKVLCILCTVILVFGMTGCGEKTDKKLMSYQVFYINSDGKLVIAFDEAEVAPASMGCPEFVIPTEVIQDMLNPGLALIQ